MFVYLCCYVHKACQHVSDRNQFKTFLAFHFFPEAGADHSILTTLLHTYVRSRTRKLTRLTLSLSLSTPPLPITARAAATYSTLQRNFILFLVAGDASGEIPARSPAATFWRPLLATARRRHVIYEWPAATSENMGMDFLPVRAVCAVMQRPAVAGRRPIG